MSKEKKLKGGALSHNMRCAANLEYIEGSCLSIDELKALAVTYNNAVKSHAELYFQYISRGEELVKKPSKIWIGAYKERPR